MKQSRATVLAGCPALLKLFNRSPGRKEPKHAGYPSFLTKLQTIKKGGNYAFIL